MPSAEFNEAAEKAKVLPTKPNDDELLQLYALYKQATVGDNTTEKPGIFDLKAKYKWSAWKELEGKTQEEAEQEYIELVNSLAEKYSN